LKNPNLEFRNPKEVRSPNPELAGCRRQDGVISAFGIFSGFDTRPSDLELVAREGSAPLLNVE